MPFPENSCALELCFCFNANVGFCLFLSVTWFQRERGILFVFKCDLSHAGYNTCVYQRDLSHATFCTSVT